MTAKKVQTDVLDDLRKTIDELGAKNSDMMALRGVHRNVLVESVHGAHARMLKRYYNDVGAEVAISHDTWLEKKDAVTDILVMGTLFQHGEVRAALATVTELQELLNFIKMALD